MLFYLVDDDPFQLKLLSRILEGAGHEVRTFEAAEPGLAAARERRPDLLVTDLIMPGSDGLEVCRVMRDDPALAGTPVVVLTGSPYDADARRARALGAVGFLAKRPDPSSLLDDLVGAATQRLRLRFWGVRGTLPVPGEQTVRYGGNTSCVSLEAPGGRLIIFDSGTGIRNCGGWLASRGERINANLLISHSHWDHINAIPFFAPLYMQSNRIKIMGPRQGDRDMREIVFAQMEDPYFPVTPSEFGAHVEFRDLGEESFDVDGIEVQSCRLLHPGVALGYRVKHAGRTICYLTDNELYLTDRPEHNPAHYDRLVEFIRGADLLITDTTYTDDAYRKFIGWGHSCVSRVADLATDGQVKELFLYHHDPSQTDDAIDAKLEAMHVAIEERGGGVKASAPKEGDVVELFGVDAPVHA